MVNLVIRDGIAWKRLNNQGLETATLGECANEIERLQTELAKANDDYHDAAAQAEFAGRGISGLRNDIQELTCGDARYTQLGQQVEQLLLWQARAAQVLPLIHREGGTQLAEFIGILMRGEVPPSTGAPDRLRGAHEPSLTQQISDDQRAVAHIAARDFSEKSSMLQCPHGVRLVPKPVEYEQAFCKDCPDCIATP